MKNQLIALAFVLMISNGLIADDAIARSIMEKVDTRNDARTIEEEMFMVLIDKNGKRRVRNIQSYSKYFGKDKYKVMFFKSPTDVKNTGFLTYDYAEPNKDDDQWLYLPALKKVKHIPSAEKSSSFMGSDFSYFDMTDRNLEDYDYKLLNETTVRGKEVWVIEVLPRNQKVINESGYIKSIGVIRKDNYVIIRSIGFMKHGRKKYFDVVKLHQQNGIWVFDEMTMTTKKGKKTLHKTLLKFRNIKVNTSLTNNLFTTRRLEKGL